MSRGNYRDVSGWYVMLAVIGAFAFTAFVVWVAWKFFIAIDVTSTPPSIEVCMAIAIALFALSWWQTAPKRGEG